MSMTALARTLVFAAAALALAACGSHAQMRTGFIPGSVALVEKDDMTSQWRASFDASRFGGVVVAPVSTPQADAYGDLSEEKLAEVRRLFGEALSAEFKGMPVTGKAGANPLVIRAAVTAIKPNKPVLNVAPQTQMFKRGYGYASCEIYATDGENGPVVAAFMQTADTQRLSTEKYSDIGTAERAAKDWAKAFRELVGR